MNIYGSPIMACAQRTNRSMSNLKRIMITHIESINIIPQDMGRVILNLINNAFYAVEEKKEEGRW